MSFNQNNHHWPPGMPSKILEEIRKNKKMNKPTDDELMTLAFFMLITFLVSMVIKYLGNV